MVKLINGRKVFPDYYRYIYKRVYCRVTIPFTRKTILVEAPDYDCFVF